MSPTGGPNKQTEVKHKVSPTGGPNNGNINDNDDSDNDNSNDNNNDDKDSKGAGHSWSAYVHRGTNTWGSVILPLKSHKCVLLNKHVMQTCMLTSKN